MHRLRKASDKSVVELSDDIIVEILHRLPSKSLSRFICVGKNWHKLIADPSLVYSCRSQRWNPHPYMIGFFFQWRDFGKEFPEIRFFFSSTKSSEVIDGSLDELFNFLGRRILFMIASSNGFVLITGYQPVYYVYNPATRQHFAVPATQTSCLPFEAVGFHCKVDDPEKNVISFTLVRYALPWRDSRSSVTIESFSSETNVWSTIDLTLDVPVRVYLHRWSILASVGVIDGVFCWIDARGQIILYDSVNRCFLALQLTLEMYAEARWLGVSGGDLYYASYEEAKIIIWWLESNIRSQDAIWVRKCAANLTDELENYSSQGRLVVEVMHVDVLPVNRHIFYLNINSRIVSYDLEKNIMEFFHQIEEGNGLFFVYEWHQWPRLLKTDQLTEKSSPKEQDTNDQSEHVI